MGIGSKSEDLIAVRGLTMAFGKKVVQRDLNFTIRRGEVFVIMGGSGCGKSTLMRHMIGLIRPASGQVLYDGEDFWAATPTRRDELIRRMGVLYQGGALWSSMTLAENVGLPLSEYTVLSPREIRDVAAYKLALVGLAGFEDYYPAEISGGMAKRAGLARAMALDPEVLFFDEPSAGLDPITSKLLDDLILELKTSLGATIVMVTHELPQIFATADACVFLDPETKTQLATGNPRDLVASDNPKLRAFLTRGGTEPVRESERTTS
ncbi:ABC transporter ATP-binding protein [Limibaculum sp. FT325]|uniref:ABC transporter ATP-binding protein n=1 Tax=Thermohalobaculum sediminis TaxID=2939436 RepID=UPI0020C0EB1A|nr:ABC transporter ATP-binding protein [Limibaculum sediminis]MCL5779322.1 ABC transporter ATP-binding protein [Limibaculum sediminis]